MVKGEFEHGHFQRLFLELVCALAVKADHLQDGFVHFRLGVPQL